MGQVHFEKASLEDVILRSDLIVVGKALTPFTTTKRIPIKRISKKVPPFSMTLYHFQVVETLYSALSIPDLKEIVVAPAVWETKLRVHADYHVKGISRHVQMDVYYGDETPLDLEKTPVILFLQGRSSPIRFAIDAGYEFIEKVEVVTSLIKKLKSNLTPSAC